MTSAASPGVDFEKPSHSRRERLYQVLMIPVALGSRRGAAHVLLILNSILVCACSNNSPMGARHEISGPALGTSYHVTVVSAETSFSKEDLEAGVEAAIDQVDRVMSTWKSDSELTLFNESVSTEWTNLGESLFEVLVHARGISSRTGGAFDVTVGPLVDLWGFGRAGSATDLPSGMAVKRALERVGFAGLELRASPRSARKAHPGMRVDLSAIAKGYAVDQVAAYLDVIGIENYLVEIGGELRASGTTEHGSPWRVAIEVPRPSGGVEAVVKMQDISIATSGDYRNFQMIDGQRFSHTLDPVTGWPVAHDLASVSVLAPDAMTADALATALTVMGPTKGFAYAVENDIPVYMLIRNGQETTEKISIKFSQYLDLMD
jgi:thiamine biosynthesis lipoprotein